jgi:hypothetical protein
MIDAKTAFHFAKQHAANMLGDKGFRLEEIERDIYKDREGWRVTLGYPQDQKFLDSVSPMRALGLGPLEYKLFLIDADSGDLVAMKLREPALQ